MLDYLWDLLVGFPKTFSFIHYLILAVIIIALHVWAFIDIREGIDDIMYLLAQPKYTYEKDSLLEYIRSLYTTDFRKYFRLRFQYAFVGLVPILLITLISSTSSPLFYLALVATIISIRFPSFFALSWIFVLISVFTSPFTFSSLVAVSLFIPLFGTFYVLEVPYLIQRVYLYIRDAKDTGDPSDYYNNDHK